MQDSGQATTVASRFEPLDESGRLTGPGDDRSLSNWLTLAVRQAVVGIATVAGLVGLARLLSPSEFALYGYATTAMLIAASIGDLGLGAALIKERVTGERIQASLGLQLLVWVPGSAAAAAVIAITGLYGFSTHLAIFLALGFLLFSLQSVPTALLERSRRFRTIAKVEASQRVLFVFAALAFALASWGALSVALAMCFAGAAGYAAALFAVRWKWTPRLAQARGVFLGFSSYWWQGRLATQLNYAVYPLLGGLLFTREQVGWLVWALAVTSIPLMLAPLAARALLPNLVTVGESEQLAVFRRLFRPLILFSLPAVAALFACAKPITLSFFGPKWEDAVPLLRLESVTTALGLVLTPAIPMLYLALDPAKVRKILVSWAAAVWIGTLAVASVASYYAPSIVQIAVAVVVLVVFDRLLRRARSYSLLREARLSLGAAAAAALGGYAVAAQLAMDGVQTILLGLAVMGAAFAVMLILTRWFEPDRRLTFLSAGAHEGTDNRPSRGSRGGFKA